MYDNIDKIIQDPSWLHRVNSNNFEETALKVFRHQYQHNAIYQDYLNAINRKPAEVKQLDQIPFLPIVFFKTHKVISGGGKPELVFESSGTTGTVNSRHYVYDASLYRSAFLLNFEYFYGKPEDYVFLCLLPSYLERGNSSLVYMANTLITLSKHPESGFYLNEFEPLAQQLKALVRLKKKVILLGVTFALLDFADAFPMDLSPVIVMETGGMKGRREEWSREQVHDFLKGKWQLKHIHSEYGMTELLSQAYSRKDGIFQSPPIMKVMVRSQSDPFDVSETGSGCVNIIDLANVHSCAFLATDDLVKVYPDQTFEILGRVDHSALRGCSLMAI